MEILAGIIVLLQVILLIQLMHIRRKMLQQIKVQNEKLDVILEAASIRIKSKKRDSLEADIEEKENGDFVFKEAVTEEKEHKMAQEALINEVLSEVFP